MLVDNVWKEGAIRGLGKNHVCEGILKHYPSRGISVLVLCKADSRHHRLMCCRLLLMEQDREHIDSQYSPRKGKLFTDLFTVLTCCDNISSGIPQTLLIFQGRRFLEEPEKGT